MKIIIWKLLFVLTLIIYETTSLEQICLNKQRDILAILDSSNNITPQEYNQAQIALNNFWSFFLISPNETRVSLINFGGVPKLEFNFTKNTIHSTASFAVRIAKKLGGEPVPGQAMELALKELVPTMRKDVERIVIVISNGKNTSPPLMKEVAKKIQAENVKIYAIANGLNPNIPGLQEISTNDEVTTFSDALMIETSLKRLAVVVCTIPYSTNATSEPQKVTTVSATNKTSFVPPKTEETTTTTTTTTTKSIPKPTTTRSTFKPEETTPTDECNTKMIDLMFALDASSSLARYWSKELTFTNNVIASLQIGQQYSLVGIVSYSDIQELSVSLGAVTNKTVLQSAVKRLDLLEGSTYIANALQICKMELMKKGREGIRKTIILVTDGADNSPFMKPDIIAEQIKQLDIRIIVVGLGYSVVKDQLNKMSTSGIYYPIEDMNKLDLFDTSRIAQDACHIEKPIQICKAKLDIVLIIDSSSQVPNNDWINQTEFAKDFINQFDLADNNTRFEIITFAKEAFLIEEFTSVKQNLMKKLESLQYISGFTRIDNALNLASKRFYLTSSNRTKLVVLLSNGLSMDRVQSIGASYDLQESGTSIMTIGTGEKADREELKILASPYMNFMRKDVKDVNVLLENSVNAACAASQVIKPSVCTANGDIIFIVDKSSDNSGEVWEGMKSLMLTTLNNFNITKTATRISIVTYSDHAKTEFRLDESFTKRDIFVAVKQLKIDGNGAELHQALTRSRQLFKIDNRVEKAKILIILTDKLPSNQKDCLNEAEIMKTDGISIIYVGLTKNSPHTFYDELATKKSVVKIENINKIEKHTEQLKTLICDAFKNRQDECSLKKLDVVTAIDKSSSLGPDNFQIELDFINRVVGNLDLRKDRTRIGVFTFQTVVDLNIAIDNSMDSADLQKEINKIPFDEGMTALGYVIGNATLHLIEKGRPDVPKVIVLLTDGSNTVGVPPQIPAVEAKKLGIKLIAVGVGDEISEKELKDISSSGEFYNVKTFKDLEKYNAKVISNDACQIPPKPTICTAAGDLIYIMGSSADKGTERFNQMSAFMKSLTKLTVVGKDNTRVAILKFNRGNYIDSGFQDNYTNFESSIDDMTSSTNGVYVGKALKASRVLFESDTRKNCTKTVIIISDSNITDRAETLKEAGLLKNSAIKVFTIGLKGKVSESDMKLVASPDKALFVDSFDNLQKYNAYISTELCEVIRGTNKECDSRQLELMIALDSSSSVGPVHWESELEFVERILMDMDIGDTLTRIGMVTFNTFANKEFGLDKYKDKYAVLSAVRKLEYDDGATAIGDALRECKYELMNSTRRDVPKAIILVTDGASTGGISPEIESTLIKKLGIRILVVGIGDAISPAQLKTLSSSGKFYQVTDLKSLKSFNSGEITRESCSAGKVLEKS